MTIKGWGDLQRSATRQGWKLEMRGHHVAWVAPDGRKVFSSKTPSDNHARQNHMALLRRAGWRDDTRNHKQGART
jgi:hypothetical protein